MFNITIDYEGLDQIQEKIARVEDAMRNLRPLAERIARVLEIDNMQARMSGVDYEGQACQPLAESTLKRRIGAGPPLVPMEMSSRLISEVQVDINDLGPGRVEVVLTWPTMPFLRYHVTGTTRMPARDPCGIRPEAWAEIEREVEAWVAEVNAA